MTDRRYDDDEVAEVFRKAAEGPQSLPRQAARNEGMTLAELQDIGREVGISPEAVEGAARSLELRPRGAVRQFLGLPIGVGRTIALDRRLSEAEWERLVVELREVFHARGTVSSNGSFRQWTNGNLQALLEPMGNGHRLRLTTTRGASIFSLRVGAAMLGLGGIMSIAAAIGGNLSGSLPGVAILSLFGIGAIANGALPLPGWARLRARQMEEVTSQLALETGPDVPDDKAST
ncbi:MAG TPA: hypothetical protein VIM15_12460 [Gemmatimonadaceae bacterium]